MSCLKKRYLIAAALALFMGKGAQAITPQSIYGGSGLGLISTAEVLPDGESSYSFSGQVEEYNNALTPGTSDLHMEAIFSYATSFGGHTEIGFVAPYSIYASASSGLSYAGSRGLKGFIKHSFTEPFRNEGTGVSISAFGNIFPAMASPDFSDGQSIVGTELHYSHWTQTTGFHLNLGYATGPVWQEAALPVFVTDAKFTLTAGMEVGISNALTFSLQALASQAVTTSDENIIISPLFSYAMSKKVNMQLGLASGLSDRSSPATNFFFAWNYSPGSKDRSRYSITGTSDQLYQQNNDILSKLDSIDIRLSQMESRLNVPVSTQTRTPDATAALQAVEKPVQMAAPAIVINSASSEGAAGLLSIEVINTTRNKRAADRISKSLTDAGYRVVSVKTVLDNKLDRSVVHYYSGLSDDAKKIGHLFPGNQIIVKRELPDGVDFRFYIGHDLEK